MVFLALMQFARMVRPPSGEAVANAKSFVARVVAVGRDPLAAGFDRHRRQTRVGREIATHRVSCAKALEDRPVPGTCVRPIRCVYDHAVSPPVPSFAPRAAHTERRMTWIALIVVVLAVVGYVIALYNRLVRSRQMAEEGWSGIDVQLRRRADLVPNLVETVQGYATHERELLQRVTEARNQARAVPAGDVAGRAQAEGLLSGMLGRLLAVVENYPELKANQNFLHLQESLATIESEIQMARRYYNGATRDLNVLVESFPSNLVAGQFGFGKRAFFETDDEDRAAPRVSFTR